MASVGDLSPLMLPGEHGEGFWRDAEVHVWLLDVRELEASRVESWAAGLASAGEMRRARAIVAAGTRRDHLAGRLALRLLLSAYCPRVLPPSWRLSRAEGGRPVVSPPPDCSGVVPSFSISHHEGYLALALHSSGEPGVDIESASREVNMIGLAQRYFSASEAEQLEALSGEELRTAFLRCWTLKEASVKADGIGLAGEMARRAFLCRRDGGRGRILTRSPDERRWQYWSWRWQPSRMLALALRHPAGWRGTPVTCRAFTLSLPDGAIGEAAVAEAHESAVV